MAWGRDALCRYLAGQCFSSKAGSVCHRFRKWRRPGWLGGAEWESIGLQKRPETSTGETMDSLRAVAGVWLLLFKSGQLLEGFEQSRGTI